MHIFISYRRDDSADVSGRIYDRLAEHFGDEAVFKDVDDIPFGVNFKEHLRAVIDNRVLATSDMGMNLGPITAEDLRIQTELGGEAAGSGGYHVGVGIGNVRVLFHPAYSGGGFRAERVDDHTYLIQNTNMGFTPRAGTLYPMTIDVEPIEGGKVRFDVTVINTLNPREQHHARLDLERAHVGPLDRVGLHRSGRRGGEGLFGPLSIELLD